MVHFVVPRPDRLVTDQEATTVDGGRRLLARMLSALTMEDRGVSDDRLPCIDEGDWEAMARAAHTERVAGLLLRGIERCGGCVPGAVLDTLRAEARRVATQNRRMLCRLRSILSVFNQEGVPVLLLKGAALHQTLYHRAELRPMADLDLLVRPEDADRAVALLRDSGCRPGAGLVRADFFPRFYNETELHTADAIPVRIDLHARPFRPLRYARTVPEDALWAWCRAVDVDGPRAYVAADEDQLVYLATHAACHGSARLRWLVDILLLVRTRGAGWQWERVAMLTRDWGVVVPFRRTLQEAEAWFGPVMPDGFRAALGRHRATWPERLCIAHAPRDPAHPAGHVVVNLLCTPGWRFRLGYLAAVLLPDRSHMGEGYAGRHGGWLIVAHLRRWCRAAGRLVGGCAGGFRVLIRRIAAPVS